MSAALGLVVYLFVCCELGLMLDVGLWVWVGVVDTVDGLFLIG